VFRPPRFPLPPAGGATRMRGFRLARHPSCSHNCEPGTMLGIGSIEILCSERVAPQHPSGRGALVGMARWLLRRRPARASAAGCSGATSAPGRKRGRRRKCSGTANRRGPGAAARSWPTSPRPTPNTGTGRTTPPRTSDCPRRLDNGSLQKGTGRGRRRRPPHFSFKRTDPGAFLFQGPFLFRSRRGSVVK